MQITYRFKKRLEKQGGPISFHRLKNFLLLHIPRVYVATDRNRFFTSFVSERLPGILI